MWDNVWVGGALVFMLAVVTINIRSLFVSVYCFLLAVISIPATHAIYTSLLGELFTNDHIPAILVLF